MYYRTTNVDRLLFLRILFTRHFAILAIENWFLPKKKKYMYNKNFYYITWNFSHWNLLKYNYCFKKNFIPKKFTIQWLIRKNNVSQINDDCIYATISSLEKVTFCYHRHIGSFGPAIALCTGNRRPISLLWLFF